MYIAMAAAVGTTIWAMYRTYRIIGKTSGLMHGVPVRRIKLSVYASVIILLLLSFACASTDAMRINTAEYTDAFWLRTANMFVFTGIAAIVIAVAATLFNLYKARK